MPEWLTIVLALGGTAIINTIVGFIVTRQLNKISNKKDQEQVEKDARQSELNAYHEQQHRQQLKADMQEVVNPLLEKVENIDDRLEKVCKASKDSIKNDILTIYYRCREKGYRNDYDYQNIHALYEDYVELHGNSFVEDIMERFDNLAIKEEVKTIHTGA